MNDARPGGLLSTLLPRIGRTEFLLAVFNRGAWQSKTAAESKGMPKTPGPRIAGRVTDKSRTKNETQRRGDRKECAEDFDSSTGGTVSPSRTHSRESVRENPITSPDASADRYVTPIRSGRFEVQANPVTDSWRGRAGGRHPARCQCEAGQRCRISRC